MSESTEFIGGKTLFAQYIYLFVLTEKKACSNLQKNFRSDTRQYSTIREDGAESLLGLQESVGLWKSKRKFGRARTDFDDFAG